MWYMLPHVMAGIGLFLLFSCLGYFMYFTVKFNSSIIDRQNNNNFSRGHETDRDIRYNDIYIIEPRDHEAARIRAQMEKDDRDLPSYDEVMRITNLSTTTTTAAAAAAAAATAAANTANSLAPAIPSGSSNISTTVQTYSEARANVLPLTPPPYTPAPMGATLILPITTPLHAPQNTQSS